MRKGRNQASAWGRYGTEAVQRHAAPQGLILCSGHGVTGGGGNDGSDSYVVARLTRQAELEARVLTLADPENLRGDAQTAWREACVAELPMAPFAAAELADAELPLDAILGTDLV